MNKYTPLVYSGFLIALFAPNTGFSDCSVAKGGDLGIRIETKQLNMGNLTRPDTGKSATVHMSASGVRTVPSNINIGSRNEEQSSIEHSPGILSIYGAPECKFRLSITSIPEGVSNIAFIGTDDTNFNPVNYIGVFSSMGVAHIQVGLSLTLQSINTSNTNRQLEITATSAEG